MTTPSYPSSDSLCDDPAAWTDIQLEEAIRDIDDTWNEMLSIRSSLTASPLDWQAKFRDLCTRMTGWLFELHQIPQYDDIINHLAEDWAALEEHHQRIDWEAMERLKVASREFQNRLVDLPLLLERTCEDVFPPGVERWPDNGDRLAVADRMEALESEVQRLRLILTGLGGCGDGVAI
jgi:hypothetical protein